MENLREREQYSLTWSGRAEAASPFMVVIFKGSSPLALASSSDVDQVWRSPREKCVSIASEMVMCFAFNNYTAATINEAQR